MEVCKHCKYRHSYECEDYWIKGGCDDFILDFETLTRKQKNAIRRTLQYVDGE